MSDDYDEEENNVHDQLPTPEEYKASVDPGARKIDPKHITEVPYNEEEEDFVRDGHDDDDLILPPPDDISEDESYRSGSRSGGSRNSGGSYRSDYDDEEQVIHDQLPTVDEIHAQRNIQKGPSLARKLGYALMTVVFLCIVIIPPIILSKKDYYEKRKQELTEFLLQQGIAKGVQLENSNSPQHKALEFLASEKYDNAALAQDKLIERYTMAVWYYSTNGPKWRYQMRFLTPEDTCEWFSWFRNQRSGQITKEGVVCDTPEGSLVAQPAVGLIDMRE